ncbi:MAG: RNA-directed DNA polymerase [Alphaproteobacteria bacterium]|nr:RNA-directed DNA polymerase [Alphaproteobacteria bacterium]
MKKVESQGYALRDCGLYNIQTKAVLAKRLLVSPSRLTRLTNKQDRYRCWTEPKKSGGTREIEAPLDDLKDVQKRISELLGRVRAPSYLMAPVKGRSYVDNAAIHVGSQCFRLLDIEDFFPSCTEKRVFWFFRTVMRCSVDVAAVLARLSTRNGRLPQGSPCSPILAFYAYFDMWETINATVESRKCYLTVYADDITISGESIREFDVWRIKQTLFKFGHRYNRSKERAIINRPADITGVIVRGDILLLPNRQHKALTEVIRKRSSAGTSLERNAIDRQIRGRIAQAGQITRHLEKIGAKIASA